MKKILFTIMLFPSLAIHTGDNLSKQEETSLQAETFIGFIALKAQQRPELVGYPELCINTDMIPAQKFEYTFNKKLTPETLLFPVFAWNKENPRGFLHQAIKSSLEYLDFETLATLKENDQLTLKTKEFFSPLIFHLTVKQVTKKSKERFENVFKDQIKKALQGHFNYDVWEQKTLIDQGILEKKALTSEYLLTEKYREKYEQFLNEKKITIITKKTWFSLGRVFLFLSVR